jgi:hypothetical protein
MSSLLDKLQREMSLAGISPRTQSARAWLGEKLKTLRIPSNRSNILTDAKRISAKAFVGRMYFFHYDAKYKDILPVWDKFPLVIPMETYSDGFLGLNLHFLDPYSRLIMLDRLSDFINNDKYDDTTSFKLSYDLLSSSRRYRMINQCTRRYLFSHIMSSMIYIEPDNWETAIFLPTQKMVYNN